MAEGKIIVWGQQGKMGIFQLLPSAVNSYEIPLDDPGKTKSSHHRRLQNMVCKSQSLYCSRAGSRKNSSS